MKKYNMNQLINYKDKDITIKELVEISGETQGTIRARIRNHPDLNGEQIIAHKTKQEATYKGKTQSIVEWAEQFGIATGTLRIRSYSIGIEKAVEFYATKKHLKRKRSSYGEHKAKVTDVDISDLEFDHELHAQRLLGEGLSFVQVANRMRDAGLLN